MRTWWMVLAIGCRAHVAAVPPEPIVPEPVPPQPIVAPVSAPRAPLAPASGSIDELLRRFGRPADPFEPAPTTLATATALSGEAWAALEADVAWVDLFEPDPFDASDYVGEELDPAALAATLPEAELLTLLADARPLWSDYPRLLGALYLQDPVGGRQRILDHLRVHVADPGDNLRAWSPAMSSLAWLAPTPLDSELVDAIACVIQRDPGHWFHYAYLTQSAIRRDQRGDLLAVEARLPPELAIILDHYDWLMRRTSSDIEADLRAAGVPVERPITAGLRRYVDGISHWTPMDRWRDGAELYPDMWWSEPASEGQVWEKYDWLWREAKALAPKTLRDSRFGLVDGEPLGLVLDVRGKRWQIEVPSDRTDEAAATGLFNLAIAADQPARFRVARTTNGDHFGLLFGRPTDMEKLAAVYRIDEPDIDLFTPLASAAPHACSP